MRRQTLPRGIAIISVPVLLVALTAAAQAQSVRSALRGQAALTQAQARSLSQGVTDKVIVVLKNQVANIPDTPANSAMRTATVRSLQHGVMSDLTATHSRGVQSLSLINAVAATVSHGEAARLAANPAVAEVVPDQAIPVTGISPASTAKQASGLTPLPGACPSNNQVQLNPEALENIHAATQSGKGPSAQGLGYTGAGVKVGFIADGLDINNPDFVRSNGQHVFVDFQDFSGTGTNAPGFGAEAFEDASAIAAQGEHTYDVAGFSGLSKPCRIRILGVAPGASLVGLNVFGNAPIAFNSVFVEAINYAVTVDHVNVLNDSFFENVFPDEGSLDLLRMANDAAVAAGVTVTAATGEAGSTNLIATPATDPLIISVGASTAYRAYAQTGFGGITAPGVKGWIDNNISGFSASGFTQAGNVLSVVAPGDEGWSLCTPNTAQYAACTNQAGQPSPIRVAVGTDYASPLTAGVAALVIQAYRLHHHGATPTPAVVKQIIVSTAQNIDAPASQQGAGMVDAYQAVLAAAAYPGGSDPSSAHPILDSATQFNATGQAGSSKHFAETLTNAGHTSVTVGLSSRTLAPYRPVSTQSVSLTPADSYSSTVGFHVSGGQARLNVAVTLQGVVSISLIAPDGDLAEYNVPQGDGNYGYAQVADPAPGNWTALVSTPAPTGGGTVSAKFQASTATWQRFGSLSASSLTLAGGASKTFTLTVATPSQPGDVAGSIVLDSSDQSPAFAAETSIPVTLRSQVPTPDPSTTFTGTLTGGNGRATNTGQTAWYQVNIPAGLKVLNAQVSTGNVGNTLQAELIDPSGEAASTGISSVQGSGTALVPEKGTQLHVLNPVPGLWTLMVNFYNTVSGTAISQPFKVTVDDTPARASAKGLPDSASIQLAAGTPVTVGLKITNTGRDPEAYFVDARLNGEATITLATHTSSTVTLPNLAPSIPTYMIPSDTTSMTATMVTTVPAFFDMFWPFGDPDLMSTIGDTSTDTLTAPDIANGDWTIGAFRVGPTGPTAFPPVPATVSMTATTPAFDPAITSPTSDMWFGSTNAAATFTPVVVNPGQTVTIPVTITPQGASGSTVSGTLYLDDSWLIPGSVSANTIPLVYPEGSQVAAFSYSYTIK